MECFILLSRLGMGGEHSTLEDDKFLHVLKKILDEQKYHLSVSYDQYATSYISEKTIKKVMNSDLLIVDISDHNPGVFYCLGIRNTIKKPFIIIKSIGQPTPFDINKSQVISVDLTDSQNWNNVKERLREQIIVTQTKPSEPAPTKSKVKIIEKPRAPDNNFNQLLDSINELKNEIKKIPALVPEQPFENSYSTQLNRQENSAKNYPHQQKMILLCKNCKKPFRSMTQMDSESYDNMEDFSRLEKCPKCSFVMRYNKNNFEFVDSKQELL